MCGYGKATINNIELYIHLGAMGGDLFLYKNDKEVLKFERKYKEDFCQNIITDKEKETKKKILSENLTKKQLIALLVNIVENAEEG